MTVDPQQVMAEIQHLKEQFKNELHRQEQSNQKNLKVMEAKISKLRSEVVFLRAQIHMNRPKFS